MSKYTLSAPEIFISLSIDLATTSLGASSSLESYFSMNLSFFSLMRNAPSPLKASLIRKDFASGW